MKLSFYGGARAVTGSCYMLEVAEQNILIDCGLQQASDEFDGNALEFYASQVDQVLLTHAHLSNAGRIPLLIKEGYYGRIFATPATKRLMHVLLAERAEMLENMARWRNQKGLRSGVSPIEPLYNREDVATAMQQVECVDYSEKIQICAGVEARFTNAGHVAGASIIELWVTEGEETRKLVFTGAIGNQNMPFAPPPEQITEADFLLLESSHSHETYPPDLAWGDKEEFIHVLETTLSHGGNLIIPVSAVGRAQEVLYVLGEIKRTGAITSVPDFPVYLDSFLAEETVNLYEGDLSSHLGKYHSKDLQGDSNPFKFSGLHFCKTQTESKALNTNRTPKVILAGSGMCDRGRVKHHLKHNLWRKESAVAIIGVLGEGSMGKRLVEGIPSVRLFGEEVVVRAKIMDFRTSNSHADRPQLMSWLSGFQKKPQHIFVVQGENSVAEEFATHLTHQGYQAHAPLICQVYDLLEQKIEKEGITQEKRGISRRGRSYSIEFVQLQDAVRTLDSMVHEGRWHSKEDFIKMTQEVEAIAKKWKKRDKDVKY